MRLVALLAVLLSCGGRFAQEGPKPRDSQIVKVGCESGGWGTGFPVAREGRFTVIATAKHVTDGCDLKEGVLWKEHDTADVSLILVDQKYKILPLGSASRGEGISSFGYPGHPGNGTLHQTRGHIAGWTQDGLIRVTAPIWFGFSGGPVLNHRNEVVCMNTATYPYYDAWSMCTSAKYIDELLQD